MTNLILFCLFAAGVFSLSFIGHKNYQNTTLYALAIGGIVNSHYFRAATHPILCFGMPMSIDSVIYTLFAFCVLVTLLWENRRSAYMLALSAIVAIAFSATMELASALLSGRAAPAAWKQFGVFAASILASILAVIATVESIARWKGRYSDYLCMAAGLGLLSILYGSIYYPLSYALGNAPQNLCTYIGAFYAGIGIAMVMSLGALWVLNRLRRSK